MIRHKIRGKRHHTTGVRRARPAVVAGLRFGSLALAATTVTATTATLTATLTATAAGASKASEKAEAKTHLLVLKDMPKGWTTESGSSGSNGPNNFPGVKQLAACIGVPSSLLSGNPPEADGPYYQSKDQALEVQDSVSVFPSVKNARQQLAAISNTKTPGCTATIMNSAALKSQITASAGKGASVGTITVTAINPALYGKNTAGFTMLLPIKAQGISVIGHLTELYFINGRLGQNISFDSYGVTFPASLAQHLTAVAIGRL
ncbi:MAG TPA: hypothetical protein VGL48_08715 [Acidimicrobiales bacterium]|jgi:hypothetical protein